MPIGSLYPDERAAFCRALLAYGFRSAPRTVGQYEGPLTVRWVDPADGTPQESVHRVRIVLPSALPFAKPAVVPLDTDPPLRGARHQSPDEDHALCLFRDDRDGWMPWMDAAHLVERIRTWFVHYHQDDWPAEDRPPDLHLYFPQREGSRPVMTTGQDWPPERGAAGRFGVWASGTARAFAGNPTEGSVMPATRSDDRVVAPLQLRDCDRRHVGVWFRLTGEPQPHARLAPLLREIDRAAGHAAGWAEGHIRALVGDRIHKHSHRLILALGYPNVGGNEEWLFLASDLVAAVKGAKRWRNAAESLAVTSFETAHASTSALMRRTAHTAQGLHHRKVLILGVGAVGSSVAVSLAKSGVPQLDLVDFDRIRPGNAVRHAAGLRYVGWPKTIATEEEIHQHAPDCTVTVGGNAWELDVLAARIEAADAVVDATANDGFSFLVNEVALRARKPVVYAACHRRAALGLVRLVRPGQDACFLCYESGGGSYGQDPSYPTIPAGDEGEFIEGGCGVPTVEAAAVDVEATANVAARSVLRLLQGRQGDANHCVIVNDSLPDVTGILAELGHHWQTWRPQHACGACSRC